MAQNPGLENNPEVADYASMLRIRLVEEAIADRYIDGFIVKPECAQVH